VAFVSAEFGESERTACKLLGVDRSSYRYEPRPDRNAKLRELLVELARQKPRFGYRRLHAISRILVDSTHFCPFAGIRFEWRN
jgi:putative transposase